MTSIPPVPREWRPTLGGDRLGAAALLMPSLLGVAVFFVAPASALVWLSTQRWNIVSPPEGAGVENFATVLTDPSFGHAVAVTAAIAAIALPLEIGCALLLAIVAVRRAPGVRVWRAVIVLPWLVAPFVSGTLWRWILAPSSGWIATLTGERFDGLIDPTTAPLLVALVVAWSETGYVALFFIAGLLAIPPAQTDAARVDGAGTLSTLWFIQLPQLRAILVFVVVTGTIRMLGVYDQVIALTGGGPGSATQTVALWIYDTAFGAFDIGTAASGSLVILGVALVGLALLRSRRPGHER